MPKLPGHLTIRTSLSSATRDGAFGPLHARFLPVVYSAASRGERSEPLAHHLVIRDSWQDRPPQNLRPGGRGKPLARVLARAGEQQVAAAVNH